MIHDLALRWVVTVLFALSAAECGLAVVTGRRVWTSVVGDVLHVVMAVAMAVMAWPRGAELPTTAPMIFFLLAAVWFALIALTPAGAGHRLVNGYHALMMLAMSWMYAVMNGHVLPGQDSGAHQPPSTAPGMTTPGMNMPGMGTSATSMSSSSGGYPAWIAAVNWLWTIGFAVAALWWIYHYFAQRQARGAQPADRSLGIACQAMIAAGMAIMFGVML